MVAEKTGLKQVISNLMLREKFQTRMPALLRNPETLASVENRLQYIFLVADLEVESESLVVDEWTFAHDMAEELAVFLESLPAQ